MARRSAAGDASRFIAAAVAAKILRTQRAGRISGALNGGHKLPTISSSP